MAGRNHTFAKRQREQKRDKKKREKLERRKEKKDIETSGGDGQEEVDPDIAHIVPGPQPVPWEQDT